MQASQPPNPFQKAQRKMSYLNVAITGPSGSGKTWSALEIATGMGGKIAVVDTENGSASLYSEFFEFDSLNVNPPYTQDKYVRAIKAAVDNGYDIVIIDSFSHVWAGEGGVQDQKDAADEKPNSNKWTNWKQPKALHAKVKNALLHSQIHVIATIRSKQAYAQTNENGRNVVSKIGMDPIAEPGIEYEFTTVFDMDMKNNATPSKDRTSLFAGKYFKPSKETGAELMKWRNSGAPTPPEDKSPKPEPTSPDHIEGSDPRIEQVVSTQSGEISRPSASNSSQEEIENPWDYRLPTSWATNAGASLRSLGVDGVLSITDWLRSLKSLTPKNREILEVCELALSNPDMQDGFANFGAAK